MIVYRDATRQADPALELSRCLTMPVDDMEALTSRLIGLGSLDAALGDLWAPGRDGLDPRAVALATATRHAARALIDAETAGAPQADGPAEQGLRHALSRCLRVPMPARVSCKAPEGFAYYGLHPLAYDAVIADHLRRHRPARALVVGLRTIGATLAAIVAARCDREGVPARVVSVRPQGPPFERRCDVDDVWRREVAAQAGAQCFVVDEGPGLSGSSLTCVAALLEELGHERRHIALVCSHDPDPQTFRSSRARQRWTLHERLVATLRAPRLAEDWSGGQWRERRGWPTHAWPAVQPQHERHKGTAADDPTRLLKFVGLGPYGRTVWRRAVQAADAGYGVPVLDFRDGYLHMPCLLRAQSPGRRATPAMASTLLKYLPWRASTMQTGARAEVAPLLELLETNTRLQHGTALDAGLSAARARAARAASQPAVIVDGHLGPWEWLTTSHGLVKADTAEHGDDHFQPGPQDCAWDVAAALTEFAWSRSERQSFVERLAVALRDRTLPDRLRWLQPCYLAARLGYASLAAESLASTEEGGRFGRLRDRYARQLARALREA